MRISYHLDEHINPRVADALRLHGVDVTTTVEVNLRTADDQTQLQFAIAERRVFVTQDSDFLALVKTTTAHSGMVFVTGGRRTVGEIVRWLLLVYEIMSSSEMVNHVEYI